MFSEKSLKRIEEYALTKDKLLESINSQIAYLVLNQNLFKDKNFKSPENILVWVVFMALNDFRKDFELIKTYSHDFMEKLKLEYKKLGGKKPNNLSKSHSYSQSLSLHQYIYYIDDNVPTDYDTFFKLVQPRILMEESEYHKTCSRFISDYFNISEIESLLLLVKNKFINLKVETKHPSDDNF
jgi:hypothetical protein